MSNEPDFIRDQSLERALPHSDEAETVTLGAIQNDNSLFPQALEFIKHPDDFYIPRNKKIFVVMCYLFEVGLPINAVMIAEELKKTNSLDSVGGMSGITKLTYGIGTISSVEQFCKIIRAKAMLRALIKESSRIIGDCMEEDDEAAKILERAGKGIFDITLENITKSFQRIGPIAHRSLQKAHQIQLMGNAITGVPTGFTDIDALTLGLQRSDLIIVAGRPSMGKTAFAVQLAANASQTGAAIAFFSLEMSEELIGNRILCCNGRIDSQRYRAGFLNTEEWNRLSDVEHHLQGTKLFIDDTGGLSVLQIKAKTRRLIAEHGLMDLLIVDYLQLMGNNDEKKPGRNREQEVSEISKQLKNLAKELNVPIVVLAQLSRKPEERADHRPVLSDLRESGSLEQDADVVLMLYREDMYKPKGDHDATYNHIAEVILAKQRNGPTGVAALRFDDPSGRFDNLYANQD